MSDVRRAYVILPDQMDGGEFVPCVVTEGQAGFSRMNGNGTAAQPWRWGRDYTKAAELASQANTELGLSPDDVLAIRVSSVRAGNTGAAGELAARAAAGGSLSAFCANGNHFDCDDPACNCRVNHPLASHGELLPPVVLVLGCPHGRVSRVACDQCMAAPAR